jgi:large-conductance mechanosensitive channel
MGCSGSIGQTTGYTRVALSSLSVEHAVNTTAVMAMMTVFAAQCQWLILAFIIFMLFSSINLQGPETLQKSAEN